MQLAKHRDVWLVPLILSVALITIAQFDYLTFHFLVEMFAIIIAFMMYALAWNTSKFTKNYLLFFLANGYFWIAFMDLMHAMAYPGMNFIFEATPNRAAQLWIATRFMEATLLLAGAVFMQRLGNNVIIFWIYAFLASVFVSIIMNGFFPDTFLPEIGLTNFKILAEYVVIGMLLSALFFYAKNKNIHSNFIKKYLLLSLVFSIASEIAFTAYDTFFDGFNMLGHIFKIVSFWMIYQALISATLISPHRQIYSLNEAIYQSPIGVAITDLKGNNRIENVAYQKLMETEVLTLLENGGRRDIRGEKSWMEVPGVKEKIDQGEIWRGKVETFDADQKPRLDKVTISPVLNYESKLESVLVMVSDITELVQVKNILFDQESAIANIVTGSIMAVANCSRPEILTLPGTARRYQPSRWNLVRNWALSTMK